MLLAADLLGADWRQPMPVRYGVPIAALTRRQAGAAIRQLTERSAHTRRARGASHRVAVDPDWIERPRGLRPMGLAGRRAAAGTDPTGKPLLPVQVKALWLLGERLGLAWESPVRRATAATWAGLIGALWTLRSPN